MTPIIHKFKGFVGHFLGDGILAIFPGTSDEAIKAALGMEKALLSLNEELRRKGFTSVDVGIGINYGSAMFSILGNVERLDANVLSDAINVASRIENLNKYYRTKILMSDIVLSQLADRDQYLIRIVDKVLLKGKMKSMNIYEAMPATDDKNERNYVSLYNEGFTAYQKGEFVKAEAIFKQCLQHKPNDHVVKLLLERCIDFQKSGVPQGWDGTTIMQEK